MPSTFLSLHYHVVFATKHRQPTIAAAWRTRLFDYLGGTIRGLGGFPEGVGGTQDHVHLLFGLKATMCIADVIREVKKASCVWIHEEIGDRHFTWQEGYAAFTVDPLGRRVLRAYIEDQVEHHRKRSFHDEVRELLEEAGVEYAPDPG
jgi:putative transposase